MDLRYKKQLNDKQRSFYWWLKAACETEIYQIYSNCRCKGDAGANLTPYLFSIL